MTKRIACLAALGWCLLGTVRAEVLIAEFMASNQQTLDDEDGDASDWIELLNTGQTPVNLAGWSLTDKAASPRQWIFPQVSLAGGARLLIFASEKNRRQPGQPLHTNFKLSADGEYLGLFKPDGTVSHDYAPKYPPQANDVSYGISPNLASTTLSAQNAVARYKLPADGSLGLTWTTRTFDDSTWASAAQGLGFETVPSEFAPYISAGGNLLGTMYGKRSSLFVRIPFNVEDPSNLTNLRLKLRYDDGYVAWLNGAQVAENLAPETDPLPWNATATAERTDAESIIWEEKVLNLQNLNLQAGQNVLAVQLMNRAGGNADALLQTEILAELQSYSTAFAVYFPQPTPNAPNSAGTVNPGPVLSEVTSAAGQPQPGIPLAIPITAKAAPTLNPVSTVTLKFRVMYNAEVSVPMRDDGTGGDGVAGDGIYTAMMTPTLTASQMLRWRVVATDTVNGSSTSPPFGDASDSPEYWGTVATDPALNESQLSVFHWFMAPGVNPDTDTVARISVFYLGEFYDNIGTDLHGRSTKSFAKKSHNLDFNQGHRFLWKVGENRVKDVDILTNWGDKTHVRHSLAYEVARLAGIPAHFCFPIRVQRNAAFYGVFDMIEDGDDRYLERAGLDPEGALYKYSIYNYLRDPIGGYVKKTRKTEPDDDLQALMDGIRDKASSRGAAVPLADRRRYAYDFLNLPAIVNYHAFCTVAGHRDQGGKNFYVYRDTNRTQQWQFLPWDMDLTLGHTFTYSGSTSWGDSYSGQGYFDDDIDSQAIMRIGWDNPIKQLLWTVPELNQMFVRRVRTLADQFIGTSAAPSPYFSQRVAEILDQVDPPGATGLTDAELDFRAWGFWVDGSGTPQAYTTSGAAQHRARAQATRILSTNTHPTYPGEAEYDRFYPVDSVPLPVRNLNSLPAWLPGRRDFFYTPGAALSGSLGVPAAQAAGVATVAIDSMDVNPGAGGQDGEYVALRNTGAEAVDLSGWKLSGAVDYTFPGGTVIPPAGTAPVGVLYVAKEIAGFRNRAASPRGGENRLLVGGYSGQISARGETLELRRTDGSLVLSTQTPAQPTALQQSLRVSALLYAPAPPTPAESTTAPAAAAEDFEWIEVVNIGTQTLSLAGAKFSEGIDFTFPAGAMLGAGQRGLVVGNRVAFEARYGTGLNILGEFSGNLDNSGERLQLTDANGENVLDFNYEGEWSTAVDELGHAMAVKTPDTTSWADWTLPATWAPSLLPGGTPGVISPLGVSFAGWQAAHFTLAELLDARIVDPLADPDGDGVPNLVEYMTTDAPLRPDGAILKGVTMTGGFLQVDYQRNPLAVDAVIGFEQTAQLTPQSIWTPVAPASTESLPGGLVRVRFATGGAPCFVRMRVTVP